MSRRWALVLLGDSDATSQPSDNLVLSGKAGFVGGVVTPAILMTVGTVWYETLGQLLKTPVLFLWVFGVMLWCAFGVVRHAESLAELLGEPCGTLILTLSVIIIEVALIAASGLTVPAVLVIGVITGQKVTSVSTRPRWSYCFSPSCSARSPSAASARTCPRALPTW